MLDVRDFERRHTRENDAALVEVVRAVQERHDSAIARLTSVVGELTTVSAVQANTIATIATTQREHALSLRENDKQHAGIAALMRFAIWAIPLSITIVTVVVNIAIHYAGPK